LDRPGIGAASAYIRPANSEASLVARYAATEAWVTQLVTLAGKDRLALDPPAYGAGVYRRDALEEVGLWGGPGSDIKLSSELARSGWRTRFVAGAVAESMVVERLGDYWHQHLRWARNVMAADGSRRGRRRGNRPGPAAVARAIERWLASLGYNDRLILVAATGLATAGTLAWLVPLAYAGILASEVLVAAAKGARPFRSLLSIAAVVALSPIDAAGSAVASLMQASGRGRTWQRRTERSRSRRLSRRRPASDTGPAAEAEEV
jgi:hypothetical protein